MATIQDIARISGYSIGTVSRVINNRADVSEETRRRIEEVIHQENYQPNSNARMLRQSVSSEISIIVCSTSNTFLHSVLEYAQMRVGEHGETANVQFVNELGSEVRTAVHMAQYTRPRGFVFLGGSIPALRDDFSKIDVPSVLIAASAEGLGLDKLSSFSTDDYGAGGCAVRKLLEQGHRTIGILGGTATDLEASLTEEGSVACRLRGAVAELKKNGVAFDLRQNYEGCALSAEAGYGAAERLLRRTPSLTAVFAISDAIAIGAMRAFHDRGLRVPQDISVVGFDGIVYSHYSMPKLATIQQDAEALANRGVDDLLMRISYGDPATHEKIPYKFVDGESIARPRA